MASGGNQGFGAEVLEDPTIQTNRTMQMLWMHDQRQQQQAYLRQQKELARQKQQADFVGKEFDNKAYATGDPSADPIIDGMLSDARAKYAKMIHDNPNMDEGELEAQMQQELGRISVYSAKVKAIRANVTAGVAKYGQNSGVDTEALQSGAMRNALYQGGNTLVTDPSQIDASQDYVQKEMLDHPGMYVKGDDPLLNSIAKYKPIKGGPTSTTEHNGITVEHNDKDEQIYPWQHYTTDAKGNRTGIAVNSAPAMINGQPLNDPETGKPMQVVDEPTMRQFASEVNAAQIKRDTDAYIQDHGYNPKDFQPGSDAYKLLARHVLYNFLDKNTPSEFSPIHKQTESGLAQKMEMGMVDALGRTLTRSEQHREDELMGTGNARIRMAANLDPEILQAGNPFTAPDGKQYIDVTDAVGGFKTLADRKATTLDPGYKQVGKILIDPNTPGTLYTEENGQGGKAGHIVAYKGKEIDGLLVRHMAANGYKSLRDVNDINSKIPISATSNPQAVKDINDAMKKKGAEITAAENAAKQQKITGQLAKLDNGDEKALNGIDTPEGKITGVSVRGAFWRTMGQNKYSVDLKDKNGKTTTKYFSTKEDLQAFVNGGTKPKSAEDLGNEYGF